jgi:hypothetical protein
VLWVGPPTLINKPTTPAAQLKLWPSRVSSARRQETSSLRPHALLKKCLSGFIRKNRPPRACLKRARYLRRSMDQAPAVPPASANGSTGRAFSLGASVGGQFRAALAFVALLAEYGDRELHGVTTQFPTRKLKMRPRPGRCNSGELRLARMTASAVARRPGHIFAKCPRRRDIGRVVARPLNRRLGRSNDAAAEFDLGHLGTDRNRPLLNSKLVTTEC